jgi:hypothetical protein
MTYSLADFFAAAEAEFDWLVTDFGFRVIDRNSVAESGNPHTSTLTLATTKTYVEVILYWPRTPDVVVQFGPLVDGKPPSIFQNDHRYRLQELLVVHGHDEEQADKLGKVAHLEEGEVLLGLRDSAETLRKEAADVLADDHTVFTDLAAYQQARYLRFLDQVFGGLEPD